MAIQSNATITAIIMANNRAYKIGLLENKHNFLSNTWQREIFAS